jgi:two-component system, sensor histidine kinase
MRHVAREEELMTIHQQLLADLVEFAPDAMLIVAQSGEILYANQRVTDLFGYRREDIVNRSVDLLLPERLRARHVSHRRDFAEDRRTRPMGAGLDLLGRRSDGTEFPLEISLSPLRDGLAAAAIRDVTDRKRVEQELINAREMADQAREEADRANLSKSRFLATASHDLRQPLQALSMLHGTLCRMDIPSNGREVLAQQGQAIDSMKRLLSALLDISKLESGAVKPEPCEFSLKQLLNRLGAEFSSTARSKGLTLTVEAEDIHTCTDQALLEQLFRNLISNAIKYTREGTVKLRATSTATGARLEVCDTGVGIPGISSLIFSTSSFKSASPGIRPEKVMGWGWPSCSESRGCSSYAFKFSPKWATAPRSCWTCREFLPACRSPRTTLPPLAPNPYGARRRQKCW